MVTKLCLSGGLANKAWCRNISSFELTFFLPLQFENGKIEKNKKLKHLELRYHYPLTKPFKNT